MWRLQKESVTDWRTDGRTKWSLCGALLSWCIQSWHNRKGLVTRNMYVLDMTSLHFYNTKDIANVICFSWQTDKQTLLDASLRGLPELLNQWIWAVLVYTEIRMYDILKARLVENKDTLSNFREREWLDIVQTEQYLGQKNDIFSLEKLGASSTLKRYFFF